MDNPAAQCEGASDGLFVYGTLAPGQVNHHVLAGVTGDWQRASLRGVLHEEGWGAEFGCPGIVPSADGETVAGYLFLSRELGNLWATLDAFEGDGYERVLALNQAEAKWTSDLSLVQLRELGGYAALFDVVEVRGNVAGLLLVMADDSAYPNANLNWFRERYARFWYVDRIVVERSAAGRGLGRILYEHCFQRAAEHDKEVLVCEYSIVPMNEGSAAFHRRMGFRDVGTRSDNASGKRLSMQLRDLP